MFLFVCLNAYRGAACMYITCLMLFPGIYLISIPKFTCIFGVGAHRLWVKLSADI